MKTKHYIINAGFASRQGIPTSFVAIELRETKRALYVYGHGSEIDNIVDCWIPKSVVKKTKETKKEVKASATHKMITPSKSGVKVILGKTGIQLDRVVKVKKGLFAIYFPFNKEDLTIVRGLEGRKFEGDNHPRYWTCPINQENAFTLRKFKFPIEGLTDKELEKILYSGSVKSSKAIKVPSFKKELYPFQEKGVGFIEYRNGRALVADEMGLGKTIQALAYLELHPEKTPVVIICPASLKLNWRREIRHGMSSRKVIVLEGTKPFSITKYDIIIINYDILSHWLTEIQKINSQVVIADEAHYFKNNASNRTKAVKKLAKRVPHFIALTGTPIVNRPAEIYNAINIIDRSLFPSFFKFGKRYCNATHNGFGWDFNGSSNVEELHEKLGSIMIRRKKSEVLKDLPDKVRSFVPFELDNLKEYMSAENNFKSYIKERAGKEVDNVESKLKSELKETMDKYGIEKYDFGDHILNKKDIVSEKVKKASNAEVLVQIEILKQLAVKGKMKSAISWIRNFLDTDGKLVVFAIHKVVIDALMKEFGDIAVKIDGSVAMKDRDKAVQQFQENDKIQLFVGNIKAAGLGLTLTAASNVAFLELPWTPGELSQAEDRCHRIGQENSVTVYYLLAQGTIDEQIASLLDSKGKVLDAVLDGVQTKNDSLLKELINKYSN
ncbi:hypothetical protein LCGC14_1195850 [marine sediment metagenome]|uniref:Helicase n=1 Tax=marine sediment metagenome TaxID=412755 RepID=A0A0F9LII4_9ZZZZ